MVYINQLLLKVHGCAAVKLKIIRFRKGIQAFA